MVTLVIYVLIDLWLESKLTASRGLNMAKTNSNTIIGSRGIIHHTMMLRL